MKGHLDLVVAGVVVVTVVLALMHPQVAKDLFQKILDLVW
jgi:hypothetical protein